MSTSLNLLLLEDSPADAELMIEVLRESGFDPTFRRVESIGEEMAVECMKAGALITFSKIGLVGLAMPSHRRLNGSSSSRRSARPSRNCSWRRFTIL